MSGAAPFTSSVIDLEKAWMDYNGHLNMAYYNVVFDRASDQAFDLLGVGAEYARERKLTIYTAEIHLCYVRELHLGDRVAGTFQLIDYDAKRIHSYQELVHVDGWVAATCETLSLHIDMAGPKVAPFPSDIVTGLEAMFQSHYALPRPERVGRSVGIRRK
ncbi:MAG: thioesterase family protein [Rhizobiaceae bacterium]|nr:thioesterase family protein [Rhizobiaceae bacterium]